MPWQQLFTQQKLRHESQMQVTHIPVKHLMPLDNIRTLRISHKTDRPVQNSSNICSYCCQCVFVLSHAQLFGNQAVIRSLRLGRLPKGSKTQVFRGNAASTHSLSSEEKYVAERTFTHFLSCSKLTQLLSSLTRFHLWLTQESMQVEDESTDGLPQASHTLQSQEKPDKSDKNVKMKS
ncbi:hypothetical protein cypCar_00028843, partial [Cyprinus carpio]